MGPGAQHRRGHNRSDAVTGSLVIAGLGDFKYKGRLYLFGTAGFGLFFSLFALSTSVPASFLLIFGVGLGSSAFAVLQSTLLLKLASAELSGRAMGLQMLAIGVLPLATALHGLVANWVGVPAVTVVGGLCVVGLMLALSACHPRLRELT